MNTYKAAVIIPTRGGATKLHYPLDALEQQTEKDFQVIVVVDGDIDGTATVVEHYAQRGILNISCIVFDENQGRTKALNAGHYAAEADILIRCDDDLAPAENYVELHLRHHDGSQTTGVIGIYLNQYPDTPFARSYGRYRDVKFREDAYKAPSTFSWHYWAGNASISTELFKEIGGYDERYRLYGWEDVDMGYEIYKRGGTIKIVPELATKHYIAATTTSGRARRALYSGAARSIFVEKHGDHVLPEMNPGGIWGLAVKTLAAVLTEKTIAPLGNSLDKVTDKLPPQVAEKCVALTVEAASYAGIKYPHRAQKKF